MRLLAIFALIPLGLAQTMNPHPRLDFYPVGSSNRPTVASVQAKVGTGACGSGLSEWQRLCNWASTNQPICNTVGQRGNLGSGETSWPFAIAYWALKAQNATTAGNYALCALQQMRFWIADFIPSVSETFSGDGATVSFTLNSTIYYWLTDGGQFTNDSLKLSGVAKTVVVQASCSSFSGDACIVKGGSTLKFAVAPPNVASNIVIVHRRSPDDTSVNTSSAMYGNNDYTRNFGNYLALSLDKVRNCTEVAGCAPDAQDILWFVKFFRAVVAYQTATSYFTSNNAWGAAQGPLNNETMAGVIETLCKVGEVTFGDNPTDSGQTNTEFTNCQKFLDGIVTAGVPEAYKNDDVVYQLGTSYGRGGAEPEGPAYMGYTISGWINVIDELRMANGTDLTSATLPNIVPAIADYFLNTVSPTNSGANSGYFPPQFGDLQSNFQYTYVNNTRRALVRTQNFIGATTKGNNLRFFLDTFAPSSNSCSEPKDCAYELLFSDHTNWTTADYRSTQAKDFVVPGLSLVSSRVSWTDANSMLLNFMVSPLWENHTQAGMVGELQLYKGGKFLLKNTDGYASEFTSHASHTTIGLGNPAAASLAATNTCGAVVRKADGVTCGDLVSCTTDPTLVTKFDVTNNKYAYMSSDMTHAYRSSAYDGSQAPSGQLTNANKVQREVTFIKDSKVVFVYDRIGLTSAAYNKIFWAVPNNPTVGASTIDETNTPQTMRINVLLPASPNIVNNTLSTLATNAFCEWNGLGSHYLFTGDAGYRVDVSSNAKVTSDNYLHAIELGGTHSVALLTGLDSNFDGGIVNSTNPAIAVFSKTGAAYATSSFTGPGWTGTAQIVWANLHPGTYNVTGAGCTLNCSGVVVGSDGIAYTEATTGALTISQGCAITTTSLPDPIIGTAYNSTVAKSGCGASTFTISAGALPNGLSINSGTGAITGNPGGSTPTVYNFTVAYDTATKAYTVTTRTPPTITSSSPLANGTQNSAYSFQFVATGDTTITWTATGVPAGLSLSTSGLLDGTPTGVGTSTINVTATNTAGFNTKAFSLTVNTPSPPTCPAGTVCISGTVSVGGTVK